MTIKDMFKKIENYNEIVEIMRVQKVAIHFTEDYVSKTFETYKDFRNYIKYMYIEEAAAEILAGKFEFDGSAEIKYVDRFDEEHTLKIDTDLVTIW